jgi:enoyl-CoA hydratase/carnithine racemase
MRPPLEFSVCEREPITRPRPPLAGRVGPSDTIELFLLETALAPRDSHDEAITHPRRCRISAESRIRQSVVNTPPNRRTEVMSIVITEDRGPVRHVVLNRPEKRNAMNQELLLALGEELRNAAADSSVHCVLLRGEGPVFSAGVDLVELAESTGDPAMLRPFRNVFLECANLCETMAKPVVCQIHRTCVGGALEVALGCDLRVASSDAQLGLPEVKFGIIPDVGGSTRLPAVVGLGRAKELIMTARLIDAAEAERIGLVNRVVAPEQLERATQDLVEELLANSHVAVGRAKRVIDASARPALAQTLEMEVAVQEYCVAAARESARREGEAQEALAG